MPRVTCPKCETSYVIAPSAMGDRQLVKCAVCQHWLEITKRFFGWRFSKVAVRDVSQSS